MKREHFEDYPQLRDPKDARKSLVDFGISTEGASALTGVYADPRQETSDVDQSPNKRSTVKKVLIGVIGTGAVGLALFATANWQSNNTEKYADKIAACASELSGHKVTAENGVLDAGDSPSYQGAMESVILSCQRTDGDPVLARVDLDQHGQPFIPQPTDG